MNDAIEIARNEALNVADKVAQVADLVVKCRATANGFHAGYSDLPENMLCELTESLIGHCRLLAELRVKLGATVDRELGYNIDLVATRIPDAILPSAFSHVEAKSRQLLCSVGKSLGLMLGLQKTSPTSGPRTKNHCAALRSLGLRIKTLR